MSTFQVPATRGSLTADNDGNKRNEDKHHSVNALIERQRHAVWKNSYQKLKHSRGDEPQK